METNDANHLEIAPATAFPVYQIEERRLPALQNEVFNHNGRYAGAGHGHSPILYGPLPVFPHPGGYIAGTYQAYPYGATHNATNVMRFGPQFNCIQQPLFHRNFMSFGDCLPVAYYPEPFDGSFLPSGGIKDARYQSSVLSRGISSTNDRYVNTQLKIPYGSPDHIKFLSLDHNMVGGFMSSGQNLVSGLSSPGHHIGGWPWMNINGGLTNGTHPRASSSPFNFFPMPQDHLKHYFPIPNDGILSARGDRDARYVNGDPHRCFQGSVAASRPFSCSQGGLSYKNKAWLSSMGSENTTVTRILNEQNSFRSQHGSKNTVRSSLTESSTVSPTIRATDSTIGNIRSGQAQWSQLTQFSKDPAPPVKRSGIQTTLATRQVWRRKTKTQPSISPSKPSSKRTVPIYHIRWNDMSQGFDEPSQPVGENCHLCNMDLACAPTDYDSDRDNEPEPSNLPNVAVLACGHAFHGECLHLITPEDHSRDPPCQICANGKF